MWLKIGVFLISTVLVSSCLLYVVLVSIAPVNVKKVLNTLLRYAHL